MTLLRVKLCIDLNTVKCMREPDNKQGSGDVSVGALRCGDSRGEQQGAVHEGAVVMVVDEVVHLAGLVAVLRLRDDLDGDVVLGVVEVNDVHVKDQYGRAGDVLTCRNRPPANAGDIVIWNNSSKTFRQHVIVINMKNVKAKGLTH